MRVSALKSTRARFCIAIALAHAAAACSGGEAPQPDAAIENVAFAPGQGAVHGFVDASAVNVVPLPDASVRLKRIDNVLTAIVTTDVHGAFISSNVPAGTYVICISGTPGFTNACSQTPFVVTAGKIAYPPHAVFGPQFTAVYGRVRLSDGTDVRYENQLYGKFVDTFVKATTPAGALVSGPVRANSHGQYVLRQVPPGTTVKIVATSENITVQNQIMVPTSAIKQDFTLPNRRPAISEVQALQNGKTVRHVAAGAVVHAKVLASDPDGHALHYQWKAPGGSCPTTDAAEVDCTMPLAKGAQSVYVQISDAHGQYEVGRARLAIGPANAMFSGKTITNGNVVVPNAEIVINGLSTVTNGNGKFSITVPETKKYVFTIKKDGFQTISKIFLHEKIGKTYKLLPAKTDIIADPTTDATIIVRVPQGQEGGTYQDASVTIKANSIIDSAGNKVIGPVTAYTSRFDHLFDKFDRMPGDTGATNRRGRGVTLASLGALEVNLRGPAGQKYNIAPGMPSDLKYPVHPSQLGIATPTIPLWYYNETTGLWEEDGQATLVGGVYLGQAKHFSAINVDLEKVNATCLKLVVDRTTLTPPFNIRLTIPGYPTKDREIDEDVEGIVRLPPNVAGSEIVVLDDNNAPIGNSTVNFTTGDVVLDGINRELESPYNECITPPSPPVTLSVDLPQNPEPTWLSKISNDATYADAYYTAISADANLGAWKDRNEFNLGDDAQASYFNAGDLEFGRSMHMKKRSDGGIAYYVTNYPDAEKAFSGADKIATVAMEYSRYPLGVGNPKFTKFYVFDKDDQLINRAELDNRGDKFVPGLCIVCHGGSKPADIAAANGNTDSKFIPFDLKSFDISPLGVAGFPAMLPRAMQEEDFRKMNEGIYFFTPATDAQKAMIDGLYPGGVSLVGEVQHDGINNIPVNWQLNNTDKNFYNDVVRPSCRSCHMSRNYPLDFGDGPSFGGTFGAACTVGYMPQSFVTWRNFWHSVSPHQPTRMEDYLGQTAGTCTGP
jgi:hypothetical protein